MNLPDKSTPPMIANCLFIAGRTRITDLTINTTGDQTAALAGGYYDIWAPYDFYLQINTNAMVGLNSTAAYRCLGNSMPYTVFVPDQMKIGGQAVSTNTTLSGMRVG